MKNRVSLLNKMVYLRGEEGLNEGLVDEYQGDSAERW